MLIRTRQVSIDRTQRTGPILRLSQLARPLVEFDGLPMLSVVVMVAPQPRDCVRQFVRLDCGVKLPLRQVQETQAAFIADLSISIANLHIQDGAPGAVVGRNEGER